MGVNSADDFIREFLQFYKTLKKCNIATEKAEQMLREQAKQLGRLYIQTQKHMQQEEARNNNLQRWAKQQKLLHAKEQSLQKQKNLNAIQQIKLQSQSRTLHNKEMSARQDDYFRGVRMNQRMRQSHNEFNDAMNLVTGNLFSWFPLLGKGVNKMGQTVKGVADYNESMKDLQDELGKKLSDSIGAKGTAGEGAANKAYQQAFEELRNYMDSPQGVFGKIQIGNSKLSDILGGAKQYFSKHKMGLMFGVGAFVGLVAVLKKALEVSPMFQQMLKLLNFGIMMVLRPIGDFFGFLMRPILIALMRYFIIPWFRVAYPFYRKWGDTLGKFFTGEASIGDVADLAWESLNTGIGQLAAIIGVGGTVGLIYSLKKLVEGINIAKAILKGQIPPASSSSSSSSSSSGSTSSNTKTSSSTGQPQTPKNILPKGAITAKNVGSAVPASASTLDRLKAKAKKDFSKLQNKLVGKGINNLKGSALAKFVQANKSTFMRMSSLAGKIGSKALLPLVVIQPALSAASSLWKAFDPEGYQNSIGSVDPNSIEGMLIAASGLGGFGYGLDKKPEMMGEGTQAFAHTRHNNKNNNTPQWQQDKLNAGQAAADQWARISGTVDQPNWAGGVINEPVFGVGRSGRTYSFGEKGSETVVPNGGGSGGITINIQNMSGSHNDLQNLRKVIMQVMQESNTSRGRI